MTDAPHMQTPLKLLDSGEIVDASGNVFDTFDPNSAASICHADFVVRAVNAHNALYAAWIAIRTSFALAHGEGAL